MHKKSLVIVIAIVVVAAIAAYGYSYVHSPKADMDASRWGTSAAASAAATVTLTVDGFSPKEVTVRRGQSVSFVNGADSSCTTSSTDCQFWPASNPHPTHDIYPAFDPRQPIRVGEVWTFVFDKVGDWGYHDHFHYTNRGTVHVLE